MKTTLESLAIGPAMASLTPDQAERLQVLALVEQFEGMLLTEMLRDVRAAEGDEEDGFGLGSSTMTDVMQGEFGLALSRAGGFGLGEMLAAALLKRREAVHHDEAAAPAIASSGAASARPTGAGLPVHQGHDHAHESEVDVADLVAGDVRVSSAFGWRRDPFSGQSVFHRGVDLALAYGSDVRSFGSGVVTAAGDRPGYGLAVVVDHGAGRETLYAHLSSLDVVPGQTVESGQRIARSGNSGRTTGAHLHFEAREFGRAVDAERLTAAWTGRPPDTDVGRSDE